MTFSRGVVRRSLGVLAIQRIRTGAVFRIYIRMVFRLRDLLIQLALSLLFLLLLLCQFFLPLTILVV